jgi:hypothetical protein
MQQTISFFHLNSSGAITSGAPRKAMAQATRKKLSLPGKAAKKRAAGNAGLDLDMQDDADDSDFERF